MQTFNESETDNIRVVKQKITNRLATAMMALPDVVCKLLKTGIVTGGISASYFHNEKENDIDVYLSEPAAILALKQFIANREPQIMGAIQDINDKYNALEVEVDGKLVTPQAVTFKSGIQIITMDTVDARSKFDFEHCKPYYDIATDKYFISRTQYDSITNKKLVLNATGPSPDAKRLEKFVDRGWTL